MQERTTQVLLTVVAVLLLAHLLRPTPASPPAQAKGVAPPPTVLRAQAIELVDTQGRVIAQLHRGADGCGNLRLRSEDGTVRVKLGATADGSDLLLFDKEVEPAVWLATNMSGTSVTLAEQGKEKRIIKP